MTESKKTTIVPNQVFLDSGKRYEPGKSYEVEIERAWYFFYNGWIEGSDSPAPDQTPVKLDIHKSWLKSLFRRSDG
jgi:hypothetical protein